MKLTKTQQELIAQAKAHGGVYSVTTTHGRGPYGGRVSYGSRASRALFALEAAGIVKIIDRQPWSDCNRGHTMGGTSIAFQLV